MASGILLSHCPAVKHKQEKERRAPFIDISLALSPSRSFSAVDTRRSRRRGLRVLASSNPRDVEFPEGGFERIGLEGCDYKHWLVIMEDPDFPNMTRDQLIHVYVKTLAQVLGSEEEARMKIYMISTKYFFAFGALVDRETSRRIRELPKVRLVGPHSYVDPETKDYGGEPFINGEALPYDPTYHEAWAASWPKKFPDFLKMRRDIMRSRRGRSS